MDLFSSAQQQEHQPLAHRMRPRTLDEFAGQQHIVGPGRLLRRSIQADQLSSVIFYGPPGTGKTTLAWVIANTTKSHFTTMNAVLSGVKQLREEIDLARERLSLYGKRTILFVDEVHRWNKSQQDALLPWVENGTVILIGATTENPFFEVNRALVSRSRIFQMVPLQREDLQQIAAMTLRNPERGYGKYAVEFESGALEHLIDIANGDARSLLNALELAVETTGDSFPPPPGSSIYISLEAAEESIQKKVVLYDKEGDYHFDIISAFIKSIRGSDPDAALYWLARMVKAGEDPRFIFRRMLISASEDIGLADPHALGVAESAAAAFDRVGMPEGRFHLTQAALYLATCEKSNSTLGFFDALQAVEEDHREVPVHLKDPSRDAEGFGHGEGYLYPHAYRDHWTAQQYLPDGLRDRVFYHPGSQGYEETLRREVERKREIQLELAAEPAVFEVLTFSPKNTRQEQWINRLTSRQSSMLQEIRSHVFSALRLHRHSRILDVSDGSGVLLWEACRQVPEGGVYAPVSSDSRREELSSYASRISREQQPVLYSGDLFSLTESLPEDLRFEAVIGRNAYLRCRRRDELFLFLKQLISPEGELSLSEIVPSLGSRLSQAADAVPPQRWGRMQLITSPEQLKDILETAEGHIYGDETRQLTNWDIRQFLEDIGRASFTETAHTCFTHSEQRELPRQELDRWVRQSYLPFLDEFGGKEAAEEIIALLSDLTVVWKTAEVHVHAKV